MQHRATLTKQFKESVDTLISSATVYLTDDLFTKIFSQDIKDGYYRTTTKMNLFKFLDQIEG